MIFHKYVFRYCLVRMLPFLAPNPIRIQDWLQSTLRLARHQHHFPLSQNDGGRAKTLRMTKRVPVHGARRMSHAPLVTATSARDTSGRRANGARCVTYREVRCHLMTSLTGYTMDVLFSFVFSLLSNPVTQTDLEAAVVRPACCALGLLQDFGRISAAPASRPTGCTYVHARCAQAT